jgi:DNA-binding SARP family transcriptional activator
MEFRLLGPLEVMEGDRALALGGPKQRSLLAVLLLHANEVVSSDRLIAELWGERPPVTAAKSVQIYVSRLRREMGERRLTTRTPGYVLHVEPAEVDLTRFERLVAEARRTEPRDAADKLRAALALWRGPPLADLAYEPFAQTEIARLEEMRLAALEARFDADLAAGRHAEIVAELEPSIAQHPLREHLRGQLMLALYRSGRQADALRTYQLARRELAEELGLEPGEELRRLERAILTHDPALRIEPDTREPPQPATAPDRSILVAPAALDALDPLLAPAILLASSHPARELIIAALVDAAEVGDATAALADRRERLRARGVEARTAAFASPQPGEDLVRLASQQDVELLIMSAGPAALDGYARPVLEKAACDVALVVTDGGPLRPGPVTVPFGAARHDWAALELGAWVAQATGALLRLIGAAADDDRTGRDASRLLADASLIVQRLAGVVATPVLAAPGRSGVAALAEDAGLLVVGLSESWQQVGLGPVRAALVASPPAPTVLVRRGPRPGGLAPPDSLTRFSWSLTAGTG